MKFQESPDHGPDQHRGDGNESPTRPRPRAAGENAVGAETRDGESKDGRGEVRNSEFACGGVLNAHRHTEDSDEGRAVDPVDGDRSEQRQQYGDRYQDGLNRRRQSEDLVSM